MNDVVAVALIGGGCSIAAASVPTILGFVNRRHLVRAATATATATDAATTVATTIGEPNGRGDVITMLTAILEWQDAHSAEDVKRMASIEAEVAALGVYAHTRFHDVLNALTITKGRTDLMWERFNNEEGNTS